MHSIIRAVLTYHKPQAMHSPDAEFAAFCCELLSTLGPCRPKRMFGGYGISTDGMTVAIIADLGEGPVLWLKATPEDLSPWEAAGCTRFTYPVQGVLKSMNYYSAPPEALESPALMAPWARRALQAALLARAGARPRKPRTTRKQPTEKGAGNTLPATSKTHKV